MTVYIVETDAPCKRCGDSHNYATSQCMGLAVWVHCAEAESVARKCEGIVRPVELDELKQLGVAITVFAHQHGKPDPALPVGRF